MKRENVIGRANVEDTPELEAYYASLEGEALGALWNVANDIEPWYPQPKSVPVLWKWRRIEPFCGCGVLAGGAPPTPAAPPRRSSCPPKRRRAAW